MEINEIPPNQIDILSYLTKIELLQRILGRDDDTLVCRVVFAFEHGARKLVHKIGSFSSSELGHTCPWQAHGSYKGVELDLISSFKKRDIMLIGPRIKARMAGDLVDKKDFIVLCRKAD